MTEPDFTRMFEFILAAVDEAEAATGYRIVAVPKDLAQELERWGLITRDDTGKWVYGKPNHQLEQEFFGNSPDL